MLLYFLAISRRKLEMPVEKVIAAVNSLDLKQLSLENVEILQRMVPTDQEASICLSFQQFLYRIFELFIELNY